MFSDAAACSCHQYCPHGYLRLSLTDDLNEDHSRERPIVLYKVHALPPAAHHFARPDRKKCLDSPNPALQMISSVVPEAAVKIQEAVVIVTITSDWRILGRQTLQMRGNIALQTLHSFGHHDPRSGMRGG